MTLALTPTVKRICLQLALARDVQKRSQVDAAKVAHLSVKGLASLYAGRGNPTLQALDSLARWHGLGFISVINRPSRLDEKMDRCENALPLLNMLNMEQALNGRMRQSSVRAESRFVFLSLGLGHRVLSGTSVASMVYDVNSPAVDVDVKARTLKLSGLCLRNPFLAYGEDNSQIMDLNGAVPMPASPTNPENDRVNQGREREGQTNDTPNDVPFGENPDDVDEDAEMEELNRMLKQGT